MIVCVSHFLHKVKTESSQLTLLRHPYRSEKYPLLLENGLLLLGNKCGRLTGCDPWTPNLHFCH